MLYSSVNIIIFNTSVQLGKTDENIKWPSNKMQIKIIPRCHFSSTKLSKIESIATHSIGEAVVERALADTAGGHANCPQREIRRYYICPYRLTQQSHY